MDIGVILTAIITVLVVVLGFVFEKERDRKAKLHERKEDLYKDLVLSLKGFFHGSHDLSLKQKFADEIRLARLYASDKAIKSLNQFIDIMLQDEKEFEKTFDKNYQDSVHELLGQFIMAMREDLGLKTKLSSKELGRIEYVSEK
ncbi:MAG: hypothetical protein A2144_10055 [Chloroflexi bacterium RBG_16_50_9]|nr:MAG: hypothetical protein A2144_10055 [Chloroflexi bacterium RBG_16_50_9]